MAAPHHASDFAGTSRYKVLRRLGAGSYGVVYEAEDTLLGGRVALKVLANASGNALFRFKNEFRSLADVKHDNLVGLYELGSVKNEWFFTMELVEGTDIVRYVWGDAEAMMREPSTSQSGRRRSSSQHDDSQATKDLSALATELAFAPPIPPAVDPSDADSADVPEGAAYDLDRLRDVFAQLTRGVAALHAASKIHRDIKPSNILVDRGGRVVLLDFGLVTEVADANLSVDVIVGTPAYMAPEQALAEDVGPACDWYSVGCVLYRTLTGRLPFPGKNMMEVFTRKQTEDPPRPRDLRPGVPRDLDELCMELLDRRPERRPSASDILERLGTAPMSTAKGSTSATAIVGRSAELAKLAKAFRTMRDDRAVVVTVRGPSGFGKTALVERFIEQAERADPGVVALTGRCYERESVPYKALDAVIDGLRTYIRRLPELERNAILPRNLAALTRLFPVFTGVAKDHARRFESLRDTIEMRRRGFAALHELLARMADRHHVILFIDDLQWGDVDSAAALAEILAPPDPPPLLLVLGYRSEEAEQNRIIKGLNRLARERHLEHFDIELGPLSDEDARELVSRLVEDSVDTSRDGRVSIDARTMKIEQIVREGAGMPFMLGELVTFMNQVGTEMPRASLVDELVRARVALLDPDARALLEVICVAGQPLTRASVCRAAKVAGEHAQAGLDALRQAKLVRTRGTADAEELETLHDRVGEAVIGGLGATALAERHAAVAEALEAEGEVDPERLGMHLYAAGQGERARGFLERAAAIASKALAFERAVRLYRVALDLSGGEHELRVKLAEGLANAGHGGEAGRAYLAAIDGAPAEAVRDLRRRAAEQFLRSGHIGEALPVVDELLADLGLKIPSTPARSLTSLLVQRAKLWIRGLDFDEKATVPPADLEKIDVCWAIGNGMGGVDVIRGADFQARHLWLALRAGEPYRISRALSWESVLSSIEGGAAGLGRAAELNPRARGIAERLENMHALAWAEAGDAILSFCRADWPRAREQSERALALFREHCADIGWEVGSMEMWWWLPSTRWLGDYATLIRHAAASARDGESRGDLYTVVGVRTHVLPHVHLLLDRPDDALREGDEAIEAWSQERWLTHHWCNAVARAHALLYAQRLEEGIAKLEQDYVRAKSALQLRMQTMRVQTLDVRSRLLAAAALAETSDRARRRDLAALAERDAVTLEKEQHPWPTALAAVGRAATAKARGDAERARASYERAAKHFGELHMGGHALAAQIQVARLEGGTDGADRISTAYAELKAKGVVNPERYASMLVP